MTGADDKARAAELAKWYKLAKCLKCGEEAFVLKAPLGDPVWAGECGVRTRRGRCRGRVEFIVPKPNEKKKVQAIEVTDAYDVDAELSNLDRSIGAMD